MTPTLLLRADRDSVCAGDDCESHEGPFEVPPETPVASLIELAQGVCPLASIAGGRATWIVQAGGMGGEAIAVLAQQWEHPRWLVSDGETAASLFAGRDRKIFFRYWCQADPAAVHDALVRGAPLPDRQASPGAGVT